MFARIKNQQKKMKKGDSDESIGLRKMNEEDKFKSMDSNLFKMIERPPVEPRASYLDDEAHHMLDGNS